MSLCTPGCRCHFHNSGAEAGSPDGTRDIIGLSRFLFPHLWPLSLFCRTKCGNHWSRAGSRKLQSEGSRSLQQPSTHLISGPAKARESHLQSAPAILLPREGHAAGRSWGETACCISAQQNPARGRCSGVRDTCREGGSPQTRVPRDRSGAVFRAQQGSLPPPKPIRTHTCGDPASSEPGASLPSRVTSCNSM